jgi:hypothetical protein
MKKDETNESLQKNHSIEAILGILPNKRSKITKTVIPYSERSAGKSIIDCM